jgi:hypothetical protein
VGGAASRSRSRRRLSAPLNGARVEYVAPAGSDGDVATVGPDGRFAFANLPPGPGAHERLEGGQRVLGGEAKHRAHRIR